MANVVWTDMREFEADLDGFLQFISLRSDELSLLDLGRHGRPRPAALPMTSLSSPKRQRSGPA